MVLTVRVAWLVMRICIISVLSPNVVKLVHAASESSEMDSYDTSAHLDSSTHYKRSSPRASPFSLLSLYKRMRPDESSDSLGSESLGGGGSGAPSGGSSGPGFGSFLPPGVNLPPPKGPGAPGGGGPGAPGGEGPGAPSGGGSGPPGSGDPNPKGSEPSGGGGPGAPSGGGSEPPGSGNPSPTPGPLGGGAPGAGGSGPLPGGGPKRPGSRIFIPSGVKPNPLEVWAPGSGGSEPPGSGDPNPNPGPLGGGAPGSGGSGPSSRSSNPQGSGSTGGKGQGQSGADGTGGKPDQPTNTLGHQDSTTTSQLGSEPGPSTPGSGSVPTTHAESTTTSTGGPPATTSSAGKPGSGRGSGWFGLGGAGEPGDLGDPGDPEARHHNQQQLHLQQMLNLHLLLQQQNLPEVLTKGGHPQQPGGHDPQSDQPGGKQDPQPPSSTPIVVTIKANMPEATHDPSDDQPDSSKPTKKTSATQSTDTAQSTDTPIGPVSGTLRSGPRGGSRIDVNGDGGSDGITNSGSGSGAGTSSVVLAVACVVGSVLVVAGSVLLVRRRSQTTTKRGPPSVYGSDSGDSEHGSNIRFPGSEKGLSDPSISVSMDSEPPMPMMLSEFPLTTLPPPTSNGRNELYSTNSLIMPPSAIPPSTLPPIDTVTKTPSISKSSLNTIRNSRSPDSADMMTPDLQRLDSDLVGHKHMMYNSINAKGVDIGCRESQTTTTSDATQKMTPVDINARDPYHNIPNGKCIDQVGSMIDFDFDDVVSIPSLPRGVVTPSPQQSIQSPLLHHRGSDPQFQYDGMTPVPMNGSGYYDCRISGLDHPQQLAEAALHVADMANKSHDDELWRVSVSETEYTDIRMSGISDTFTSRYDLGPRVCFIWYQV
ncbi:hypothetical protein BSLG_006107 [Batrachochytrium salamandrivorans]|nr:hypothetical protein BSLG_006107 [Batrachochytrium salamandrivorans]